MFLQILHEKVFQSSYPARRSIVKLNDQVGTCNMIYEALNHNPSSEVGFRLSLGSMKFYKKLY